MINPNELRLDNFVISKSSSYKDVPIKITGITSTFLNGIAYIINLPVSGITINDIEPIPLTEEILLKCGFEAHYFGIKTYYNPLFELDHDFKLMGVDYNIKVMYLHQLQNLYFSITGKELEVKL